MNDQQQSGFQALTAATGAKRARRDAPDAERSGGARHLCAAGRAGVS
jgi:hypothetical protein